jgi:thiamine pyrophosphokinase
MYVRINIKHSLKQALPDFIVGDLDSCNANVLEYYRERRVDVAYRPSKDDHDLSKSIDYLHEKYALDVNVILVLGGLDGRVDHTIAAINTLYQKSIELPKTSIYLLNLSTLTFYIARGTTKVQIDPLYRHLTCGLLPIYKIVQTITTKGFKWNLGN